MKRIFMLLLFSLFCALSMASAQSVIVTGTGADETAAVKDASRNAVEQVVGTLVDSKTLVQNAVVQLDEIYTKSQGFVSDVQILSRENQGGLVTVRAKVEVNTSPDAQLMNNLRMIMNLNDPRIAVVILKRNSAGQILGHDMLAESALNDRLLNLGFSHVIDAGVVSNLQDAQLLNRIYQGVTKAGTLGTSLGADYLVLGESRTQAQAISLPDGNGGYTQTLLKTGNATLNVRVIRFDTGDIVGTFTSTAKGVENSNEMAEQKAVQAASEDAAKKLEEKFRHFSAATGASLELDVFTSDSAAVQRLVQDLKGIGSVQNVYLREQGNGKSVLTVETTENPSGLLERLKANTKLGIFVAGMTGSTVKLSVSR